MGGLAPKLRSHIARYQRCFALGAVFSRFSLFALFTWEEAGIGCLGFLGLLGFLGPADAGSAETPDGGLR